MNLMSLDEFKSKHPKLKELSSDLVLNALKSLKDIKKLKFDNVFCLIVNLK